MSPEQAELSGLDVDTRSDIYSLGVLLDELLTGVTPFDKARLREVGFDEWRRIIREEEPARPSARISTIGGGATVVSSCRQSDPKRLSRCLRGELDWMVMKALEKDRNRRYETAGAFASDGARYLADEPVSACPPSGRYRLGKFVRRNRGAVLGVGLVLLALVTGTLGTSWGLVRAVGAEQQARLDEARAVDAEQQARAEEARAVEAEKQARIDEARAVKAEKQARTEEARAAPGGKRNQGAGGYRAGH